MKEKSKESMEEMDKKFEERFEKDLNQIKDRMDEFKLSDEFKAKLKERMDYEYNKKPEKKNSFIITRKFAASLACCCIIATTCVAFADDIENWAAKVFSNTDKIVERAIEVGNYQKLNIDYIENDGVSIKPDYVIVEDGNIYIALDIKSEKEYDQIYLDDIKIEANNEIMIFENDTDSIFNCSMKEKKINKNSSEILLTLKNRKDTKLDIEKINIELNSIKFEKDKKLEVKNYEWNFDISLNK